MPGKLLPTSSRVRISSPFIHNTLDLPQLNHTNDVSHPGGEPRRSGRATKGQHTKNLDDDIPPPAKKEKKSKGKGGQQDSNEPEEEEEEEEEDSIVRCICGAVEDEGGWMMISCEQCTAWQHNLCMDVTEDDGELENIKYYCEQCHPEDHKALLDAIAKGQKPWEDRQAKRRAEEKKSKKKKGAAKKGGRQSTTTQEPQSPAAIIKEPSATQSPVATIETGSKRKLEVLSSSTNGQHPEASAAPRAPSTPAVVATSNQEPAAKRTKSVSEASRRVSVAPPPKVDSIDKLNKERAPAAKYISSTLKGLIQKAVKDGSFALTPSYTAESYSTQIALDIEHALHVKYADDLPPYSEQFRAICFNIKKNNSLLLRVLSGSLTPAALADMKPEQMASEELQKERAAIKEEADKQAVLLHDTGPRYRKTHKGEELVDEQVPYNRKQVEEAPSAPVRRRTMEEPNPNAPVDTGSPPPSTELPDGYDQAPAYGEGQQSPTQGANQFNIQQVWQGVEPTTGPAQPESSTTPGAKQEDVNMQDVNDPELSRLLKDEMDIDTDDKIKWSGTLSMNTVGSFKGTAQFGCGYDMGIQFPYADLLASTLDLDGRISSATADKYVSDMRFSQSNEVCGLVLSPLDDDVNRSGYETVFNYFKEKDRWGVIAIHKHPSIRDLYVVPIAAGDGPLPNYVSMLTHSDIPTSRPTNLLVLTLVVRTKSSATPIQTAGLSGTPVHPQTPVNPHGPSFSPVAGGSSFPTAPTRTPSFIEQQILGPYISTPVVRQILDGLPDSMTEVQLQNLKDILENRPETRNDIFKLSLHLNERQGIETQNVVG